MLNSILGLLSSLLEVTFVVQLRHFPREIGLLVAMLVTGLWCLPSAVDDLSATLALYNHRANRFLEVDESILTSDLAALSR